MIPHTWNIRPSVIRGYSVPKAVRLRLLAQIAPGIPPCEIESPYSGEPSGPLDWPVINPPRGKRGKRGVNQLLATVRRQILTDRGTCTDHDLHTCIGLAESPFPPFSPFEGVRTRVDGQREFLGAEGDSIVSPPSFVPESPSGQRYQRLRT